MLVVLDFIGSVGILFYFRVRCRRVVFRKLNVKRVVFLCLLWFLLFSYFFGLCVFFFVGMVRVIFWLLSGLAVITCSSMIGFFFFIKSEIDSKISSC